jgi:hypothetical protein
MHTFAVGSQSFSRLWLRKSLVRSLGAVLAVGLLGACSPVVLLGAVNDGDDAAPDATRSSPDSRAVRLSSVDGQVRVVQDGQIIADPATANLPLFEGSQISTGDDGRAEVQMEDGSLARLSPNSTITVSLLRKQGTSTRTELVLNQGLAYFELQPSNAEHSLRVNYGTASFAATGFSVVRIRMDLPPGDLAVFSGNVHLERGDALQIDVHGGESLNLDSTDLGRYTLAETIEQDSWDSWNADRDQALNAMAADKTAASGGIGIADGVGLNDLDANGSWYNVPGQGYIWSPYDAQAQGVGWDPYGYGRWVYYPRYGYVWVSGYGWGYAPYQCGLWNYYDTIGWGWLPGTGCNPWWQNGGWGYGLGNYPRGYLPPRRPVHPVGPQPGHPRAATGRPLVASSVIPVDRRKGSEVNMAMYAHPAQPVTINGHTVQPLSPIASRPVYERPGGSGGVRAGNNGYVPGSGSYAGSHSVYSSVGSGSRPSAGSHPSGGGGSGGSSGGGHIASSGGGSSSAGGGGHASGGGGGGGGTHK